MASLVPGLAIFHANSAWLGKSIKPLLSLSGTFLLAISFCHLLPEAYSTLDLNAGYFVLGGFFLQVILEYLTHGVEHGHYHPHGHFTKYFPVLAIGGLTVHSIIESLPMMHDHNHQQNYLLGIIMHKAPIAITLASILKSSPLKTRNAWIWFLPFCLSAPLTVLVGNIYNLNTGLSEVWLARFSAIAVGIFLHVGTTILFELEDGHKLKPSKLLAILLGLAIYFLAG